MLNWWRKQRTEEIPDSLPMQVIVACVNAGYARSGLLENWARSLARLGLESQVVIAALDDEAAEIASKLPGQMLRFKAEETQRPTREALLFRRAGWKPVVFSKLSLVRQLLQSGRHVLFSDADVVFLKDPRVFFPGESRADFAAQCDAPAHDKEGAPRSLCSGLYFAHPTREAVEALRFTAQDLEQSGGDQDFLRRQLGVDRVARCVMLPRDSFPNGNVWKKTPPVDPVAVHFNWIEGTEAKVKWIQDSGLWRLG